MLKPISWRELETIFKGLIIELDAIQIEKEKQEKIIARDVKAQKIIREDFKRALIKGKITDIELEQGAALEHFALDSKGYRAAVIRLDREKAKFTERNWELISICLETSAKNFFEGENCWHIFVDRERNFLYLICTDEIESADDARMIKRMKQLKNKIYTQRALLDSTISAAIGSFQRTPQELCLSATVAVELLGRSVDNNLTVCYNKEDEVRQGVFLVNRAILFIRDNYSRPITLKEVAEHIFLHPSYLSSLFRQVTGKRFVDYLTDYRMEQAKQMLADPKYKINEIANLCGYESHKYFSAVFRERMGMTPSEYRRNL